MNDLREDNDQDFSDSEDVLSLANLPIQGYKFDSVSSRVSSSSDRDRFEFVNSFGVDLVRNDLVSLWGKTGNKSCTETHSGFKSGSYHEIRDRGLRSASVRKIRSSSVRVTGLNQDRFDPVRNRPVSQVSPSDENGDKALSGREPTKPVWRGFSVANVLAKFGCLSA